MRHKKAVAKLGRTSEHRRALLRNLVTSFFEYEKIKTTDSKAKELRRVAEKMITLAKRGDLHARRQVLSFVQKKEITAKLFEKIAPRFQNVEGGYTRIVKVGNRPGDNAPVSIIELVAKEGKKAKKKTAGKKEKTPRSKAEAAAKEPEAEKKAEE